MLISPTVLSLPFLTFSLLQICYFGFFLPKAHSFCSSLSKLKLKQLLQLTTKWFQIWCWQTFKKQTCRLLIGSARLSGQLGRNKAVASVCCSLSLLKVEVSKIEKFVKICLYCVVCHLQTLAYWSFVIFGPSVSSFVSSAILVTTSTDDDGF